MRASPRIFDRIPEVGIYSTTKGGAVEHVFYYQGKPGKRKNHILTKIVQKYLASVINRKIWDSPEQIEGRMSKRS